jgi:thiol-disulfide isomerase/thioredoxin
MRARTAVLIALLAACTSAAQPATSTSSAVATPLPLLQLPRIGGGTWSSASARGSVLVLDVWASWCKPCSKGFPRLDALAASRPDVVVIAISIDEDPEAIRAFVATFPLAVTVAHDVDHVLTHPPVGIAALPALLIVDETGVIRQRLDKPTERDYDRLGELVDRLRTDGH